MTDGPRQAECRICHRWRPLAELYVPDGSAVIDISPPIYQHQCVDRGRCRADAESAFDGCARDCRARGHHTLEWGRCEFAVQPPPEDPEFGWWRVVGAADGGQCVVQASLPLLAVLPWAGQLDVAERHRMLAEATDSSDPAGVIERWRRVAERRRPVTVNFSAIPPNTTGTDYGPGHVQAAYEQGRRQGRHEAGA